MGKKLLIVLQDATILGGIQTLASRLASGLYEYHEVKVDVLILGNEVSPAFAALFPVGTKLICLPTDIIHSFAYPLNLRKYMAPLNKSYNSVLCFTHETYLFSYRLSYYLGFSDKSCLYVVLPDYVGNTNDCGMKSLCYYDMKQIEGAFSFINEMCKKGFEGFFGREFDAPIIPLPITPLPSREKKMPNSIVKKIVSIGRIEKSMKTYNWNLIEPLGELVMGGHSVEWHIYGGGKDVDIQNFMMRIKDCDYIHYHGQIPYSEIPEVLADAYLFVGMGTIAMEAGSMGIPSVCATAYATSPESNGYIHQLPFGNVGEASDEIQSVPTISLIEEVLRLDKDEYSEMCAKSKSYAQRFSGRDIYDTFYRFLFSGTQSGSRKSLLWHFVRYFIQRVKGLLLRGGGGRSRRPFFSKNVRGRGILTIT